jgi:hypothetical protein
VDRICDSEGGAIGRIEEAVENALLVMQNALGVLPLLDLGVRYEEGVWSLYLRVEYLLGVSPDEPSVSWAAQRELRHKLRSLGLGLATRGVVQYSQFRCERCGYLETPEVDGHGRHCLHCHGEVSEPEVGEESLVGTKILRVSRDRATDLIHEVCGLLDALPQL